jgi:hypothetical protein
MIVRAVWLSSSGGRISDDDDTAGGEGKGVTNVAPAPPVGKTKRRGENVGGVLSTTERAAQHFFYSTTRLVGPLLPSSSYIIRAPPLPDVVREDSCRCGAGRSSINSQPRPLEFRRP